MSSFATALVLLSLGQPTPLRTPAAVDDAYSLKFNPAGLGSAQASELRLLYTRTNLDPPPGGLGSANGFATYGALRLLPQLSLAASVDVAVDANDQTQLGTALGLGGAVGPLSLGVAWTRNKAQGVDARNQLDAGFQFKARYVGLGLAVGDVAQTAGRRRWDIGFAVRPFDRLTVSSRWRLTQSQGLNADTLDLLGLVTAEPLDGLTLGVAVGHDAVQELTATAQLELSFGRLGVGASVASIGGNPSIATEVVMRSNPTPSMFKTTGVVVVDLGGSLIREPKTRLFPPSIRYSAYADVPLLLAELEKSDSVRGLFVRIGPSSAGWARAQEARRGLLAIRKSGRRVDCQLGGSDDLAYFIASACDEIIVTPPSLLQTNGLSYEVTFLGQAIDKLGVDVQVIRRGKYKSSPEQFSRDRMSDEQAEALNAYIDDVFETYVDSVAAARDLPKEKVLELIDVGVHTSSEAAARGLVDHVLYPDEVEEHLQKIYGASVRYLKPSQALPARRPQWGHAPSIAIIHIDQTISGGESQDSPLASTVGGATLLSSLERARLDPNIKGVVLRVDTPGGDALASDLIARGVEKLAKDKPVAASFGNVAASGGYYAAAPARVIFAEKTTLTGSIGVFTMLVSVEEMLARLGLHTSFIRRGENADTGSWVSTTGLPNRAVGEKVIEHFYDQFLEVVARGRKMDKEKVRALAEGRIWSGADAKTHGLVDHLGGLTEALRWVRTEAGFDPDDVVSISTFPKNRRGLPPALRRHRDQAVGERLLNALSPKPSQPAWMRFIPAWTRPWLALGALQRSGARPLAMSPFVLKVD